MREEYQVEFSKRENGYDAHLVPCGNEVAISQDTPGTTNFLETSTDSRRDTGTLHRYNITAADKAEELANTDLATADNGAGTGSLVQSTTYYVTAIPGNQWGDCKVATTINTQATAAYGADTGSIRLTIPSAIGADFYDIFLSTDAAPKWVGRLSEARRAAGDFEITAVGVLSAGGGNPAGTVDINVAGTGIQTSNAVFAQNNAWMPDMGSIVAIDCTGKHVANVLVEMIVTDLRSVPSGAIVPFFTNQLSPLDWHQGLWTAITPLRSQGNCLAQAYTINVYGTTGLKILCGDFVGQGTALNIWVELS